MIITRMQNIKAEVEPERIRPIDSDLQASDTTKFKAHTGWEPLIPFEQTIKDLLDYWRERITRTGYISDRMKVVLIVVILIQNGGINVEN